MYSGLLANCAAGTAHTLAQQLKAAKFTQNRGPQFRARGVVILLHTAQPAQKGYICSVCVCALASGRP
jgi:hypothetical protein